jgi:hypothetical protein
VLGAHDGQLRLLGDYFGRGPRDLRQTDAAKRPTGYAEEASLTSFVWPVSDVLASLTGAGLRIDHFSEHPHGEIYPGIGPRASWLPAVYAILASSPA